MQSYSIHGLKKIQCIGDRSQKKEKKKKKKKTVGANWTLCSNCIVGGQAQYLISYVQTA